MSSTSYAPPDDNPEDEVQISRTLDGEFARPCETFRGAPLWPYTPGTRNLYAMAQSDNDSKLYRILAFVFIHIRRTPPAKGEPLESAMERDIAAHVIPIIWDDLNLFRMKVLGFRGELSDEELTQAIRIAQKELKLEGLTEIAATPPDVGSAQKKSIATTHPKRAGKSSPRRKT